MASRAQRIAAVAREIFGTLPNRNARTGAQILKRPLVAHYHERWYMEPIEPAARAVRESFIFDVCLSNISHASRSIYIQPLLQLQYIHQIII